MKKLITLLILIVFFLVLSPSIVFAIPNPAAVYCEELGHDYRTVRTPRGEYGVCILPNKKVCEGWEFFKGKCGKEHSYCAKNGFGIKTATDGKNPFSSEYAVCIHKGKRIGPATHLMNLTKILRKKIALTEEELETEESIASGEASVATAEVTSTTCAKPNYWCEKSEEYYRCPWHCTACGDCIMRVDKGCYTPDEIPATKCIDCGWGGIGCGYNCLTASNCSESFEKCGCSDTSFSWKNKGGQDWMTPVKDQGKCGSCWAFASLGVVEAEINIVRNNPDFDWDGAEQDIVSCSGKGSCSGGGTSGTFSYLEENIVVDEACFPYTASDASCNNKCNSPSSFGKIDYYQYVGEYHEVKGAKDFIKNEGPILGVLSVGSDVGGYFDEDGIYRCAHSSPELFPSKHGVVIVGWNDYGRGYVIAKNSWGSTWNGDGYFKIGYSECDLAFRYAVKTAAVNCWIGDTDRGSFRRRGRCGNYTLETGCDDKYKDYCLDSDTLMEYRYDKTTFSCKQREFDCIHLDPGTYCSGGACTSCTDSDAGKNYLVRGYVSGYQDGEEYTYTDYCIDNINLAEYYCFEGDWTKETYDCRNYGSDYYCSYGICRVSSGGWGGGGRHYKKEVSPVPLIIGFIIINAFGILSLSKIMTKLKLEKIEHILKLDTQKFSLVTSLLAVVTTMNTLLLIPLMSLII